MIKTTITKNNARYFDHCRQLLTTLFARICCPAMILGVSLGISAQLFLVQVALADLKICNTTASRVGVAIGYRDDKGWATEGWWYIASHNCKTLLNGNLDARFYYIHAIDYDRGGVWAGESHMCTQNKKFTIRGVDKCEERGHKRTRFFEIDTTERKDWTVQLSDPTDTTAKAK